MTTKKKHSIFKFIGYITLVLLLFSCTTIPIREKDAFDAKRTVTVDDLRREGVSLQEITFSSDDTVQLKAWYLSHEDARGTVLYLGGNGFLLAISEDILSAIYSQGMNVFAFDYRGYGRSSGKPSVQGLKNDVHAAYVYLTGHLHVSPDRLVIHGHSLGTVFALWLANQVDAAGVVLESPITDARDLTNRLVPTFLKPFVRFDIEETLLQDSNLEQITRLQKPLLIVTGMDDPITPKDMAETLYQRATVKDKNLIIIDKGGHNDLPRSGIYRQALSEFYMSLQELKISAKDGVN